MFNKKKITLLSFATSDLSRSVKRFKKQANESNYYDQILIMSPDDLKEKDKQKLSFLLQKGKKKGVWILVLETITTHKFFRKNGKRKYCPLYGYWFSYK